MDKDLDDRQSIFNLKYYKAIRTVHSDMSFHLGKERERTGSFLLVGISDGRVLLLAPIITKEIERKELRYYFFLLDVSSLFFT